MICSFNTFFNLKYIVENGEKTLIYLKKKLHKVILFVSGLHLDNNTETETLRKY